MHPTYVKTIISYKCNNYSFVGRFSWERERGNVNRERGNVNREMLKVLISRLPFHVSRLIPSAWRFPGRLYLKNPGILFKHLKTEQDMRKEQNAGNQHKIDHPFY